MGYFKNNRGMTMVEVVVVSGILLIIGIAFTQLTMQMVKTQGRVDAMQEVASIVTEMQSQLSREDGCREALGTDQDWDENSASQSADLDGLKLGSFTLPTQQKMENESDVPGYSLKMENLRLINSTPAGTNSSGQDVFRVDLNAVFSTTRNVSGSSVFRERRISSIFATVENGKIIDCATNNITSQDIEQMCQAMGGTFANDQCDMGGDIRDCYTLQGPLRRQPGVPYFSQSFHCDGPEGNGYGAKQPGVRIITLRCQGPHTLMENLTSEGSGTCITRKEAPIDVPNSHFNITCCTVSP